VWAGTRRPGVGDKSLVGDSGNDVVLGGRSSDSILGGPGNDWVAPLNDPAYADVLTCGSGFDRVLADSKDVVAADCEKVLTGLASEEEFFEAIPQSFDKGLPPNPER
jgi:Ca2+-binding RTX toxin-like protein